MWFKNGLKAQKLQKQQVLGIIAINKTTSRQKALLIALFRIQYSVIQFFLTPYMDKGVENPEEWNLLFCNVFLLLYIY